MKATPLPLIATWSGAQLRYAIADAAPRLSLSASPAAEVLPHRLVTSVVTDSRKAGTRALFVAIAGERTDGHRFVGSVAQAGATAALVSDVEAARVSLAEAGAPADFPLLVVDDTVEALGELARGYLAHLRHLAQEEGRQLSVLGVTGSVGKTTTKDLTRQILATQGPTVAPIASFNNEIGLPLTVLEADEHTRYLMLEMGASGPGHIAYLTRIAPLDAAAVLMVGHAHMGGFGSIEGVAKAKAEIIEGLVPSGTAILNIDDPRVAAMAPLAPGRVITLSRKRVPDEADAPTLHATLLRVDEDAHPIIDLSMPNLGMHGLRLGIPGEHNVANALAAAGLAYAAGLRPEQIMNALTRAGVESPHRLAVSDVELTLPSGLARLRLVDDAYNANIDSVTASLATFPALAGERRRIAVISEMLELGESSQADHAHVGELVAAAGVSVLVTIGAGASPCATAAAAAGVRTIEVSDARSAMDLLDSADSPLADGDAILFKGSNGSGAWRVADHLLAAAAAQKEEHHS